MTLPVKPRSESTRRSYLFAAALAAAFGIDAVVVKERRGDLSVSDKSVSMGQDKPNESAHPLLGAPEGGGGVRLAQARGRENVWLSSTAESKGGKSASQQQLRQSDGGDSTGSATWMGTGPGAAKSIVIIQALGLLAVQFAFGMFLVHSLLVAGQRGEQYGLPLKKQSEARRFVVRKRNTFNIALGRKCEVLRSIPEIPEELHVHVPLA